MYHSITIGDKNTWDDWHLVAEERPLFNPPELKTNYIEIPGSDTILDFTESLTGYPTYYNRKGSWEFYVMNGYQSWDKLYTEIMEYLHGLTHKAFLEDDPDYYYVGRFTVNEWKSEPQWSKIVIDYNVEPYKLAKLTSIEDNSLKAHFSNISINSETEIVKNYSPLIGRKPVCPIFKVSSTDGNGMIIHLYNKELNIDITGKFEDGETQSPEYMFSRIRPNNELTVGFIGKGTVDIKFRNGRL